MPKQEKLEIIIVVNGKPTEVEANPQAALHSVIEKALQQTGNSGQPAENWELRDGAGALLDPAQKIADFHFHEDVRLFLNLKAGVGGE